MSYTVLDALKGVHSYPVQAKYLQRVSLERGLSLTNEMTTDILHSNNFRLAEADIMIWVATAPNVTEGGVQIALLAQDRLELRVRANDIYRTVLGTEPTKSVYGDKGDTI